MHKMLLEIPMRIEAERIVLRMYEAGDGQWFKHRLLANSILRVLQDGWQNLSGTQLI